MRYLLLLLALALASTVFAQTANVIELEAADATKAQKAWDTLQKAQAEWNATQNSLRDKYVLVKTGDPDAGYVESGMLNLTGAPNCLVLEGTATTCPDRTPEQIKKDKEWEDAHTRYYRRGFQNGFEFSKDFKFIVPKPPEVRFGTGTAVPQWGTIELTPSCSKGCVQ